MREEFTEIKEIKRVRIFCDDCKNQIIDEVGNICNICKKDLCGKCSSKYFLHDRCVSYCSKCVNERNDIKNKIDEYIKKIEELEKEWRIFHSK